MRSRILVSAGLAAGLAACTTDQTPTGPNVSPGQVTDEGTPDLLESGNRITLRFRPTVDGGVRNGTDVLEGSVVQTLDVPGMEDRGIIEFDISGLSGPVFKSVLRLEVYAATGPYPFSIDVFAYSGDGVLAIDDWNRGTLLTSFQYAGEEIVLLDVTSAIRSLVASGASYAGFNFQFSVPSQIPLNGPFVAFRSREYRPAAVLRVRTKVSS
jgi:hypothetical protein